MAAPNIADLATSLVAVAPDPANSGTSLTVTSGEGNRFPSVPFNATAVPEGELPTIDNSEIVLVTARTDDTFTITRAQGVTSAKSIAVGWRIFNGIYGNHVQGAYDRANHTGSQAVSTITGLQTELDGKLESGDIADFETTSELNARDTANRNTDNHTSGTTNKVFTATEQTKLSGIEDSAEVNNISDANATDLTDGGDSILHYHASDRDRANHNGSQAISTVIGLQGVLDDKADLTDLATVDTKAAILALSPTEPQTAFATDTSEFFIWDGTTWKVAALKLSTELQAPDRGSATDSDKLGYSANDITDKKLHNITLLGNVDAVTGGIRVDTAQDPDRFQVYLRDKWNTFYDDMTIDEGDFRHTPLEKQIYIWRGDSVEVGLNGRSMIQEYKTSRGAYPPPVLIDGGTF